MEVFIIRHTALKEAQGLCYGHSEMALAETFAAESQRIVDRCSEIFDVVFSSPLQRCTQLAGQLPAREIRTDDRLKEVYFGSWEGKVWNDIPRTELDPWMDDFVDVAPPAGESLRQLYTRVNEFLNELRNVPHQRVALVTHAGVVRCVWAALLGIPLQNIFKIQVSYGQIQAFELGPEPAFDRWLSSVVS